MYWNSYLQLDHSWSLSKRSTIWQVSRIRSIKFFYNTFTLSPFGTWVNSEVQIWYFIERGVLHRLKECSWDLLSARRDSAYNNNVIMQYKGATLRPSDYITLTLCTYNTHSFYQFGAYFRTAQLTIFTTTEFLPGQTRPSVTMQSLWGSHVIWIFGSEATVALPASSGLCGLVPTPYGSSFRIRLPFTERTARDDWTSFSVW